MKTYTRHNCRRQHRSIRTWLRCAVPALEWVQGDGDVAVIAWCWPPTVTLWESEAEAREARAIVDATGCGSRCRRRHEVVQLRPSLQREGVAR